MPRWSMRVWFDLAYLVVTPKMARMDRAITASEANQRFSEMLREVAEGDSFTVLSRGRPVARVTPIDREDEKRRIDNLLEYVRKLPLRCVGPWNRESLYD